MTYALTSESAAILCEALRLGAPGATLAVEHPARRALADVEFEHARDKLTVTISMEHGHNTIRLQAGDSANAQHIREQLEALANGTADTAETGAIGTPTAPAREPFALDATDEASLRHLARIGGTRHLACGVSITVHAPLKACRRDAVVTTLAGTAHLHAAAALPLYALVTEHIEAALNAA